MPTKDPLATSGLPTFKRTEAPQQGQPVGQQFLILVVDDAPDNLAMISIALQQQGYQIVTAANGEDAISVAEQTLPNLILMGALAECVRSGMTRTVGVSNFGQTRMLAAYSSLARHNIQLASNQVHFSLLNRTAEKSGTLARCKELGIRLIAYSPIEKGLLSGKYTVDNPPPGSRSASYTRLLPKLAPLIKLMTEIGQDHGGKSNAQVALNWTICKGALPIPGAKNAEQAQQNAGALGWRMTEAEVARLDESSDTILE